MIAPRPIALKPHLAVEAEQSRLAFAVPRARGRQGRPRFAHARSVRNAVEQARLRLAFRIVSGGGRVHKEDLVRIEDTDIRLSA